MLLQLRIHDFKKFIKNYSHYKIRKRNLQSKEWDLIKIFTKKARKFHFDWTNCVGKLKQHTLTVELQQNLFVKYRQVVLLSSFFCNFVPKEQKSKINLEVNNQTAYETQASQGENYIIKNELGAWKTDLDRFKKLINNDFLNDLNKFIIANYLFFKDLLIMIYDKKDAIELSFKLALFYSCYLFYVELLYNNKLIIFPTDVKVYDFFIEMCYFNKHLQQKIMNLEKLNFNALIKTINQHIRIIF